MKWGFSILIVLIGMMALTPSSFSQSKEIKIALLSSFYLDTHFDIQGKPLQQKGLSKQSIPSLEFYEGVSLAVDSLIQEGVKITLQVFDIQTKNGNVDKLIQNGILNGFQLILGQVSGSDYLKLAGFSKSKNIPFVSATYPNDGGIRESSSVYIVNPKINSHLLVAYNQVTKKWPNAKTIWIQSSDSADNKLTELFKSIYQSDPAKKMLLTQFTAKKEFTTTDLAAMIDTTKKENVLIVGSINENFMIQFSKALSNYPKKGIIQVVGLPVWEGFKEIQNKEYNGIPIYYTSSFYAPPNHTWHSNLDAQYKNTMGNKVPINATKGFELIYYFGHILHKYSKISFTEDKEDHAFKLLTDFDFKGISWSSKNNAPDYFENKRIYFLRRLNGVTTLQ